MMNFFKRSILGKILYIIRDFYRFPNGKKVFNKIKKNKNIAILLGVPTFNNLGDHLIAAASKTFIKNLFPDYEIVEVPTQFFVRNKDKLKVVIRKDVPVFIVGGGWMGNIWEEDEYRMQDMIKTFSNNKIIILPQTVFYDFNKDNAQIILNDAINTYNSCENLTMFFRDNQSYEFGEKYFANKNIKVFLAPDIALYSELQSLVTKKKIIRVCIRKDREKTSELKINNIIKQYCINNNYKYVETDTVIKKSIPLWKRSKKLLKKVNEFAQSSLIITDRLHGMIFAALSNTKCIAFDNKTKKVSGVYKLWLKDNKNIILFENKVNEEELITQINNLIKIEYDNNKWKEKLNIEFNKMKENIKK